MELDSQATDDALKPGKVAEELAARGTRKGGSASQLTGKLLLQGKAPAAPVGTGFLDGRCYRFAIAVCTGASGIRFVQ